MRFLHAFVNTIDRFSKWQGSVFCWLIFPLIFVLDYEITARYLFNAPTLWAYDLTYMTYGCLFMFGAAYTLLVDQHVRIEAIHQAISPKTRTIFEIIGYLVFFFPALIALLIFGSEFAWESWVMKEAAKGSIWGPPIYPFKAVLPAATLLLLLQGIAQFIRCVVSLMGREL
jgi:TRAP-type mannitol/chloroaromatic compound transport system permease small subunit